MAKKNSKVNRKKTKNVAMLVVRNQTRQEVTNVIFPNGLTIGADDAGFKNGAKVFGDAQVVGTLNAQDVKIDGTSIVTDTRAPMVAFTHPVITVDTDHNGGSDGGSLGDGQALMDADIPESANTSLAASFGTDGIRFEGHGTSSDTPTSGLFRVQVADITATTSRGTALTVENDASGTSGDTSFTLTFKKDSTTVITLTVSTVSIDGTTSANFKVSYLARYEESTNEFDNISFLVPARFTTSAGTQSITRGFVVQKVKAGQTGTLVPQLVLDVNSNAFAFADAAGSSAAPPTIVLLAQQVSQSSTLVTGDFSLTGYDSTNLSSHLGSFSVTAAETGTSTASKVITYNSAMATKFPLTASVTNDGLTATKLINKIDRASSPPDVRFRPSVISVQTSVTGGTPLGVASPTTLSNTANTDIFDHDISANAMAKAYGIIDATAVTFGGHGVDGTYTANTFRIQTDDIHAHDNLGNVLDISSNEANADGTVEVGDTLWQITGSAEGTSEPRFCMDVNQRGASGAEYAELRLSFLAEHTRNGGSTDFDSILVDVPFRVTTAAGAQTISGSFEIVKNKQGRAGDNGADGDDGDDGDDGHATPHVGFTSNIISVQTSVTGGTPNGVTTTTTETGMSPLSVFDHDIPSTAYVIATGLAGATNVGYDGHGVGGSYTNNTFRIQTALITGSTNLGDTLAITSKEADGTAVDLGDIDYQITGSMVVNEPLFCMDITRFASTDAKFRLSFLAEHTRYRGSDDFDSIRVDVPFRVTTAAGAQTISGSFEIVKNKKGQEGTDGSDGSTTAGVITVEQFKSNHILLPPGLTELYWDGSNRQAPETDYNLWDLHTQVTNVGSQFSQDVVACGVTFSSNTTDLVNGDATVEHDGIANLIAGLHVTADSGVDGGTYVLSITDDTHFEMSRNATGDHTNEQLTFGPVGRIQHRHSNLEIETDVDPANPDTVAYDSIKITSAMTVQLTGHITLEFSFCAASGITSFGRAKPQFSGMCCVVTHNDVDASSAADAQDMDIGTELGTVGWYATYGAHDTYPLEGQYITVHINTTYTLASDESRWFWLRVGNMAHANFSGTTLPRIRINDARLTATRIL